MTKVIMHGCNGRMGQVISELVAEDNTVEIVAGIDLRDTIENSYPVYANIKECNVQADVIIDFATAKAVDDLLGYSADRKIPVVLCTTGLSEEQIDKISKTSKKVAVLRSANMSLGVNTMIKLVQVASNVLASAGFDMEIIEKHHNQKIDAPSGTALALAEAINEVLSDQYTYQYDRTKERKVRNQNEIGIHAVRGGTIVGEHEVVFAGTDEVIEIKHTAYSKSIFGKGAISAAKFLAGKAAGLYQMKDIIG